MNRTCTLFYPVFSLLDCACMYNYWLLVVFLLYAYTSMETQQKLSPLSSYCFLKKMKFICFPNYAFNMHFTFPLISIRSVYEYHLVWINNRFVTHYIIPLMSITLISVIANWLKIVWRFCFTLYKWLKRNSKTNYKQHIKITRMKSGGMQIMKHVS